jgi:arginine deiminase
MRLSQKLNVEVLAVSMPPADVRQSGYRGWTEVHTQFLHLDSFFNIVDEKKALAVPYLLEESYADNNPITRLLHALDQSVIEMQQSDQNRHRVRYGSAKHAQKLLNAIGWVTRYEAGTGEARPTGKKLVDVMRERGFDIIPVGGEQGSLGNEQYLLERVLFELNMQAGNVVAVRPGVVIACSENSYTIRALQASGVQILPFDGSHSAMWHGGPHCLTMPLERG